MNVGNLMVMESQGHPIVKVAGKINHLEIGDIRTGGGRGQHSKKSKIIE